MTIKSRIKRIQSHLGVKADGLIGPMTLTAFENAIRIQHTVVNHSLEVTKRGLHFILKHEIGSEAYYRRRLTHPVYPGGASGVTIGIGYDLGYHSRQEVEKDWKGKISDASITQLMTVCGKTGRKAKAIVGTVKGVTVPLGAAREVFYTISLPKYAAKALKTYPGLSELRPGCQVAMLSLVYNRGTRMSGSRRREMKAIRPMIAEAYYQGIARQMKAMKRLWRGKGLDGLLTRRDQEAAMVMRPSGGSEVVRV